MTSLEPPDLLPMELNDYGNARRLLALHDNDLCYCPPMRAWLLWNGQRWEIDQRDRIRRLAQDAMLLFVDQAMRIKNETLTRFASTSLNSARVSSTIREAQPMVTVLPSDLDTHHYAINFANGTLDVRNGELRQHDKTQLLTKLVHVNYDPEANCPQFVAFLGRTLGGLTPYVQKCLGYSLTGTTTEKAIFFAYGPANSGKTTLLEVMRHTFAEYSTIILVDSLMASREDNNSQADLADLRGVRFCMTSETEEGQTLKEGKLKRLSQGQGMIKSCRKYENPVTFPETHKLWLDSNHKPTVRGTDDAIWNRLHLIPFENPLKPDEIDRELPDKLREESPGIVAWVVAGARRWHSEGIGRSAPVEKARDAWRSEMDRLGQFLESSCVINESSQVGGRALYKAYRAWAEGAGERPMTETSFGLRLGDRGFEKHRARAGVIYERIGLLTDYTPSDGKANGSGALSEERP